MEVVDIQKIGDKYEITFANDNLEDVMKIIVKEKDIKTIASILKEE